MTAQAILHIILEEPVVLVHRHQALWVIDELDIVLGLELGALPLLPEDLFIAFRPAGADVTVARACVIVIELRIRIRERKRKRNKRMMCTACLA